MSKNLLKIASLALSNCKNLSSPKIIYTPLHTTSSRFLNLRYFTSKNIKSQDELLSGSGSGRPISPDVEDCSKEALKGQIERYLAGDAEAIPDIFEAIMKRKLAGTHEESDDELMQDLRKIPINSAMDKDVSDEDTSDAYSSDADNIGAMTPDSDADEFYRSE